MEMTAPLSSRVTGLTKRAGARGGGPVGGSWVRPARGPSQGWRVQLSPDLSGWMTTVCTLVEVARFEAGHLGRSAQTRTYEPPRRPSGDDHGPGHARSSLVDMVIVLAIPVALVSPIPRRWRYSGTGRRIPWPSWSPGHLLAPSHGGEALGLDLASDLPNGRRRYGR